MAGHRRAQLVGDHPLHRRSAEVAVEPHLEPRVEIAHSFICRRTCLFSTISWMVLDELLLLRLHRPPRLLGLGALPLGVVLQYAAEVRRYRSHGCKNLEDWRTVGRVGR